MCSICCAPSHRIYNHYGSFGPLWKKVFLFFLNQFFLIFIFIFLNGNFGPLWVYFLYLNSFFLNFIFIFILFYFLCYFHFLIFLFYFNWFYFCFNLFNFSLWQLWATIETFYMWILSDKMQKIFVHYYFLNYLGHKIIKPLKILFGTIHYTEETTQHWEHYEIVMAIIFIYELTGSVYSFLFSIVFEGSIYLYFYKKKKKYCSIRLIKRFNLAFLWCSSCLYENA